MHGTMAEPLAEGHRELVADEGLARSAAKRWPIGSSILLMAAISAFLWIAIYLGVRAIF